LRISRISRYDQEWGWDRSPVTFIFKYNDMELECKQLDFQNGIFTINGKEIKSGDNLLRIIEI